MSLAQQAIPIPPPSGTSPDFKLGLDRNGYIFATRECRHCLGDRYLNHPCRQCRRGVETVTEDDVERAVSDEIADLVAANLSSEAWALSGEYVRWLELERLAAEWTYALRKFQCPTCNWKGERAGDCACCWPPVALVVAAEMPVNTYEVLA